MQNHLENLLADHCGAVLLGVKPASLFTLERTGRRLDAVTALLAERGITALALRQSKERTLVLAFAPTRLGQALRHPLAQKWLAALGYPAGGDSADLLVHLKERFAQGEGFPHEIGFFLGYPPCDVVGFMVNGGRRYKHCCMWKVYGDVEKAKTLCEAYNLCRRVCRQHIEAGGRLAALPRLVNHAG